MPIFDYACSACNHEFEALVLPGKTAEITCPACNGASVERLLSLPWVRTQGTRDRALRAARRRDEKRAVERVEEQRRYEQAHDDH